MLDFPAPKTMAKALRGALAERDFALSHAQCLDLVARQLGYADWNVLEARIDGTKPSEALVMPEGWFSCGRFSRQHFRVGTDPTMRGIALAETIADEGIPDEAFAGLMQSFSAQSYRGRRVRLTAELKTRDAGTGTIWLRVDPADGGRSLAFDNMMGRSTNGALSGDADWTERAIVLDVGENAQSLHFGFFLKAPGAMWARGFRLETVGEDVPVTNGRDLPPGPVNLDFH